MKSVALQSTPSAPGASPIAGSTNPAPPTSIRSRFARVLSTVPHVPPAAYLGFPEACALRMSQNGPCVKRGRSRLARSLGADADPHTLHAVLDHGDDEVALAVVLLPTRLRRRRSTL